MNKHSPDAPDPDNLTRSLTAQADDYTTALAEISAALFAAVSAPNSGFHQLLDKYFEGKPDPRTLQLFSTTPHD